MLAVSGNGIRISESLFLLVIMVAVVIRSDGLLNLARLVATQR